ncbi:GH3 auxin-responsive promoter family protein [Pseudoalteromonas arctica]|uniref:GH3 auxin-responsive promoter family protein n=1 Tax=Pseudoalteromonas arctica TaxID=394751 RepID=A0A7Y0DW08_9GAMM|nr:GH3 auxin-responsive promoter family protein [Pseudoalteromonas arctica]NMM42643.1 GH3 auxin-responsive promoter family protein [Pseudoalteromonas arctica]
MKRYNRTQISKKTGIKDVTNEFLLDLILNFKYCLIFTTISIRAILGLPSLFIREKFLKTIELTIRKIKMESDFAAGGEKSLGKFNAKTKNCRHYQLKLLAKILKDNQATEFGKAHNFSRISTIEEYRSNIALQSYDDLMPYIERHLQGESNVLVSDKVAFYATTSGTTGKPKYIPTTAQTIKCSNEVSARIWSYSLYKNKVGAFDGKMVVIVSSAQEGFVPDGTPFGSTSGQYVKNLNESLQQRYVVPYEVFEIKDYSARYHAILLLGIIEPNTTMLSSANPSTLLILAKKCNEFKQRLFNDLINGYIDLSLDIPIHTRNIINSKLKPSPLLVKRLEECIEQDPEKYLRPIHFWPNLNVITCWQGGNCGLYVSQLPSWYGNLPLKDLGYLASEIRGTIPLDINSSDGVLTIDENFFEFKEVNTNDQVFLLADELEIGKQYYIYFTNNSGLYRYDINDIVEVTGFHGTTPKIKFIQKGKGVTNITGEKLYENQVIEAIKEAERKLDLKTAFYYLMASVKESKYILYCEFLSDNLSSSMLKNFVEEVECQLRKVNIEYTAKRDSMRLGMLELVVLGERSFERTKEYYVSKGVREGQFKHSVLGIDESPVSMLKVVRNLSPEEICEVI